MSSGIESSGIASQTPAPLTIGAPDVALAAAEEALLATAGIPVERRETIVNGQRLHFLTCGEGEPLLLLHGRGDCAAFFTPIFAALARYRRIFALDLPGWGLSDKPPFTGRTPGDALAFWVGAVLGFLEDQGIPSVDVLGHSMGGFTALGLALAYPERVRKLILVDSGGLGTQIQLDVRLYFALGPERLHRLLGRRFTRAILRLGEGVSPDGDASGAYYTLARALWTQESIIPSGAAAFSRWVNLRGVHLVLRDRLAELAMPVLMLWGDRDNVTPYHDALVAARLPRDGTLVAFTGCGHAPFRERPDDFTHILLTWLQGIYVPSRV